MLDKYVEAKDEPAEQVKAEPEMSVADELMKLKQLLDADLITKEEFEQQKINLL